MLYYILLRMHVCFSCVCFSFSFSVLSQEIGRKTLTESINPEKGYKQVNE